MIKIIHFIILGPYNGECTFFSMKHGWVTEENFDQADWYPEAIFSVPMPVGATGIMGFTPKGEPCSQYDLQGVSPGVGVENIFEKTY